MPQTRQLAAIMFTDIVGYTALMGEDEQKAFKILTKNRELQKPIIEKYNGRWIKELGDGVMASFTTVSDAVYAAIKINEACSTTNNFQLRIGIHVGEVVFDNGDVFGDGVNIASRLQSVANPGCIFISEPVYYNVSNKKDIQTRFVKEERLKNVKEPIRIYEVLKKSSISIKTENQMKSSRNSIAVLPFVNMSKDPEQEFFSDGISEEIINALAQVPNLNVAGRTSCFQFKGEKIDLREIGDKLQVNTVLEGSVRTAGNRIRITAQLIDVHNGFHLWSERYDRVLNDVFEVQDEIARAIAEKLQATLGVKSVELKTREQTQSVEAYQHYLKGRALGYKRGKELFEALQQFQRALEIDPEYALAYAGLADAYIIICIYGYLEPWETWPKAIHCAKKAMEFGPDLAETYNCNATISMLHDLDFAKSEKQYLKALQLNPSFEQARCWYALQYLQYTFEKHDEAIRHLRLSLQINPLSAYTNTILAIALGIAGLLKEAVEKAERGVELDPTAYYTQLFSAQVYTWSGEYEKALQSLEKALTISGRHSWALLTQTILYADWGKPELAFQTYEELTERSRHQYIQPSILACAAATIGHNEDALKFAHLASDVKDPHIILVAKCFPAGKSLRVIPGFDQVLKKIKLL